MKDVIGNFFLLLGAWVRDVSYLLRPSLGLQRKVDPIYNIVHQVIDRVMSHLGTRMYLGVHDKKKRNFCLISENGLSSLSGDSWSCA